MQNSLGEVRGRHPNWHADSAGAIRAHEHGGEVSKQPVIGAECKGNNGRGARIGSNRFV